MHFLLQSSFEVTGTFEEFRRNENGKLRMLMRVESGDVLTMKVPKDVRTPFADPPRTGMKIAVRGVEERRIFGEPKRVVSWLRLLSAPAETQSACAKCPIRVCSKKNCWKNGGKQLWDYLENRIAEEGLEHAVELKVVGCLGNCK